MVDKYAHPLVIIMKRLKQNRHFPHFFFVFIYLPPPRPVPDNVFDAENRQSREVPRVVSPPPRRV